MPGLTRFGFFLVATISLLANSCTNSMPPAINPLIVLPSGLVSKYRDDPQISDYAYRNQPVLIYVADGEVDGSNIHWFLFSGHHSPPALIFRFPAQPKVDFPVWIKGICRGRIDDGMKREKPGFTFHVLVSDCSISPAPSRK